MLFDYLEEKHNVSLPDLQILLLPILSHGSSVNSWLFQG